MNIQEEVTKLRWTGANIISYNSFAIIIDQKEYNTVELSNGLELIKIKNNKLAIVERGFGRYSMNKYFTYVVSSYKGLHCGLYIKDSNTNLLRRFKFVTLKGFVGDRSIAHSVGILNSKVVLVENGTKNFLINYKGKRLNLPNTPKSELQMLGIISKDKGNTYTIGYGDRDLLASIGEIQPVRYLDSIIMTVDSELNIIK